MAHRESNDPIVVGRYLLHRKIARGGMATIHIARLLGDVGFSRIVATKRMHPELVEDHEFVGMFLDEARIASKIHHRNVVPVLDVVQLGGEIMLVQEYIHGAPLSLLLRKTTEAKAHVPVPVAAAIACQTLAGLHAAHTTLDELGTPLHIVHRDVSPQNIIVGDDGTVRLLDFGIAKAASTGHITRRGIFKGKLAYSSPEQIRGEATQISDIYSLGVVLWELLVGRRLHPPQGEAQLVADVMAGQLPTITEALAEDRAWIGTYRWGQLEALSPIVRKALDTDPRRRWQSAADMEEAIANAVPIASPGDVAAWLRAVAHDFLELREKMIAEEEESWRRGSQHAVPSRLEALPSAGIATEPEGSLPPRALAWPTPTMLIAIVAVLFAATTAFLLRDLASARSPTAASKPHVAEPLHASVTPSVTPIVERPQVIVTAPPEDTTEKRAEPIAKPKKLAKPASRTEPAKSPSRAEPAKSSRAEPAKSPSRTEPAPTKSSSRTEPAPAKSSSRTEPAKPTASPPPPPPPRVEPPRADPPPPRPAPKLDCTPPFYFEGTKKVFKPGCL